MADKATLRRELAAAREALAGRDARSEAIARRLAELPPYRAARAVSSYVGVGTEVSTTGLIRTALATGAAVSVPWRLGDRLLLARITTLDELQPASLGLLEPSMAVRSDPRRMVPPESVDLILVPGLGFDRAGGRLGHGKGYYDRLLREAGRDPLRVGLAFECQMVAELPVTPIDEPMDLVVTEAAVYRVSGRTASEGP